MSDHATNRDLGANRVRSNTLFLRLGDFSSTSDYAAQLDEVP